MMSGTNSRKMIRESVARITRITNFLYVVHLHLKALFVAKLYYLSPPDANTSKLI